MKSFRDDFDVRNVPVEALGEKETYDLIRLVARNSGLDLATATDEQLALVYRITDGNPFLTKLITRRYVMVASRSP
jgi:hypothetical protein